MYAGTARARTGPARWRASLAFDTPLFVRLRRAAPSSWRSSEISPSLALADDIVAIAGRWNAASTHRAVRRVLAGLLECGHAAWTWS